MYPIASYSLKEWEHSLDTTYYQQERVTRVQFIAIDKSYMQMFVSAQPIRA